jgi:putative hydrolase of the HAD superfamily
MITAVVFDLDDTLVPEAAAEAATLRAVAARVTVGATVEAVEDSFRRHCFDIWADCPAIEFCHSVGVGPWEGLWGRFNGPGASLAALREWTPAYRIEAWRRCLAELKVTDSGLSRNLAAAYPIERHYRHHPAPFVNEILADLTARYTCRVLTNGAPDVQRDKLRASGLDVWFPDPIVSGDPGIGVGKPNAKPFLATIEGLGCPPDEVVMVGDSWPRDIVGALAVGMKAVWLDSDGQVETLAESSVVRISDLRELPKVIDNT